MRNSECLPARSAVVAWRVMWRCARRRSVLSKAAGAVAIRSARGPSKRSGDSAQGVTASPTCCLKPLADDAWLVDAHNAMMQRTRPVLVTAFGGTNSDAVLGEHTLVHQSLTSIQSPQVSSALTSGQPQVAVEMSDGHSRNVLCEPLNAPVALHLIGAGRER